MLYCPNYNCQAPNPEKHQFCERCRMPLPKRYVWAVGKSAGDITPGQTIADRYRCKASRIFLDTHPGMPPATLSQFPPAVLPYLRLAAYQIHVPQAYGWMQYEHPETGVEAILLLEYAAIATPARSRVVSGPMTSQPSDFEPSLRPLPTLVSQWSKVNAMRQLNWLWQIVKLWQPLAAEQVVSSLLDPDLLRVEDHLVRLLELRGDRRTTRGVGASLLAELGQMWQQWVPTARPEIRSFLEALCQHLINGKIQHPGQVLVCLDRALNTTGKAQTRQINMATQTDRGPSRPRNEDACYPSNPPVVHLDSRQTQTPSLDSSLVIVCDGIGGHSGGDVASTLAIETLYAHLETLNVSRLSPVTLVTELRRATCIANDVISERNDSEQRRDRDRMGTTLVMGLLHHHELYITHLGDSRAYLVTSLGCHQMTLDDDVASREARLGYGTYRNALYQPSAGSLVQALGMSASGSLHPTVQRLVLEGEGVLLLCSDGLSDNDLLESIWQTYLTPLLQGKADIQTVAQQLIDAANRHNGHDNVTVGLIGWSVMPAADVQLSTELATPPALTSSISSPPSKARLQSSNQTRLQANTAVDETAKTQLIPSTSAVVKPSPAEFPSSAEQPSSSAPSRSLLPLILSIVFLLALGGVFAYILLPSVSDRIDTLLGINRQPSPGPLNENRDETPPNFNEFGSDENLLTFKSGEFVQIRQSTLADESYVDPANLLVLIPAPQPQGSSPPTSSNSPESGLDSGSTDVPTTSPEPSLESEITQPRLIPAGSVLKVLKKQESESQDLWVQLQLCSLPVSAEQLPSSVEPIESDGTATSSSTPVPQSNTSASSEAATTDSAQATPSNSANNGDGSRDGALANPVARPVDLLVPGQTGWITEALLAPAVVNVSSDLTPTEQGACQNLDENQ